MASEKFLALRKELVEGKVLLPGDEGFDDSLQRWSATNVKPAAVVFQPRTVAEVSAAVKFATANGIPFNVRGGGHSTSQTSCAPSPDGAVLDLSLMRDVSVDAAAQTVTFGGGCLWCDLDDALAVHGLATVGGTVSHTGVGGLILHGGFGFLTGLHGLTIDILVSCQVVLADGSIVTASEKENPDLFWALRGAGSSFGVVTQFTSRAFPQGQIWGGSIFLTSDKLPPVIDFMNHWHETNDGRQAFLVAFTHAPPMPGSDPTAPTPECIMIQMSHIGPDPEKRGLQYFAPVLELESFIKQVGPMPYERINKLGDEGPYHPGRRYQFGGANFALPLSAKVVDQVRSKFFAFQEQNSGSGLGGSLMLLECFSRGKIMEVPNDVMAFGNRGPFYNVGLIWVWDDEKLDQTVRERNREFQKETAVLGEADEARDGTSKYLNYISTEAMSAETAFGKNAARLRELKKKYDPANVFNKLWKLVGQAEERPVL